MSRPTLRRRPPMELSENWEENMFVCRPLVNLDDTIFLFHRHMLHNIYDVPNGCNGIGITLWIYTLFMETILSFHDVERLLRVLTCACKASSLTAAPYYILIHENEGGGRLGKFFMPGTMRRLTSCWDYNYLTRRFESIDQCYFRF